MASFFAKLFGKKKKKAKNEAPQPSAPGAAATTGTLVRSNVPTPRTSAATLPTTNTARPRPAPVTTPVVQAVYETDPKPAPAPAPVPAAMPTNTIQSFYETGDQANPTDDGRGPSALPSYAVIAKRDKAQGVAPPLPSPPAADESHYQSPKSTPFVAGASAAQQPQEVYSASMHSAQAALAALAVNLACMYEDPLPEITPPPPTRNLPASADNAPPNPAKHTYQNQIFLQPSTAAGAEASASGSGMLPTYEEVEFEEVTPIDISRTDAERLLQLATAIDGEYYLRKSSQPGACVLTVLWQGAVHHFQLAPDAAGCYSISEHSFPSLGALVATLKTPHPNMPLQLSRHGRGM